MPKYKTGAFLQDWGTLPTETIIVLGYRTKIELLEGIKTNIPNIKASALKRLQESNFAKYIDKSENDGFVYYDEGRTLLYLKTWNHSIYSMGVFIHELSHLIDFIFKDKGMLEETEARAYQTEYLFSQIATRLDKIKLDKPTLL